MTIKDEICPQVKADVRLCDDGTLWIKTEKLDKVGRVIVEHGTRCKQFYQDAKPEQPKGVWIPVGVYEVVGGESAMWGSAIAYHKCSECDEKALKDDFEKEVLSEFCPHCGSRMEGVAE